MRWILPLLLSTRQRQSDMQWENLHLRSPCNDYRGVDLISDVLPFGRLWYDTPDHAVGYAMHSSRSHEAVIRFYDAAGNVSATHEHAADFR